MKLTRVALCLAFCISFPSVAAGQTGEPNTVCNSSGGTFSSSGSTGSGTSNSSQEKANRHARENLNIVLGQESGIICEICETGIQCERRIQGVMTDNIVVRPGPMIDEQFTATATYMGSYEVICKKCVSLGGPPIGE